MNSDAVTNNKKGFLHSCHVTPKGKVSGALPIRTTTEFAFAMEFASTSEALKANIKVGGIVFQRIDL